LISKIGPSAHDAPAVERIRQDGGDDDRGKSNSQKKGIVPRRNRCTLCSACQAPAPCLADVASDKLCALTPSRDLKAAAVLQWPGVIPNICLLGRIRQPDAEREAPAIKPTDGNLVRHIPTRRFAAVDGRRAAGSAVAISAECHCNSATPWRKPLQISANPCLISDLGRAPRRADSYR